jgi:hypothetical protein
MAAIACLNLFRPWWTGLRAGIRLAVNGCGLILIGLLFLSKPWFEVIAPHATSSEVQDIAQWVDGTAVVLLLIYALSFWLRGIQDSLRLAGREPIRNRLICVLTGE